MMASKTRTGMIWGALCAALMILAIHPGYAQTSLESCARKLNESMMNLARQDSGTDPRAQEKLARVVKEWEDCACESSMPSFRASTIQDEQIDSTVLKGKIVVVNFWFTTCAPCVAELPGLNRLVEKYKGRNVLFLGITFENKSSLEQGFLRDHQFEFKIIPEAGSLEKPFGVTDYPSTFIVDGRGRVRKAWSGGKTGPEAANEVYEKAAGVIDRLLQEN